MARSRHVDRLPDGVGAAGAAGGRRTHSARTWRRLADRQPANRRRLGRGPVHGDRLPRRLLHQLRDVPARVPDQRTRTLPSAAPAAGVSRTLVVTALRTERAALHRHVAGAALARTGMGPDRARRWRAGTDLGRVQTAIIAGLAG